MTKESSKPRLRLAIFTTEDVVWGLTTWQRTLPALVENHDVVGIYLFPERLGRLSGMAIPKWYYRIFGLWTCTLLALFSLKQRLLLLCSPLRTWEQLAQNFHLRLLRALSPNDPEVVSWARENRLDIILIMVGDILKEDILSTARLGVINKHAAILPTCRGLFPYLWAKVTEAPTGVTLHVVDTQIDTGKILLQIQYPPRDSSISMLRFYIDIFAMYPAMVTTAIHRLKEGRFISPLPDLAPSYYSLPTPETYTEFHKRGFRICQLSDLYHNATGLTKEVLYEICGN